MKQRLGKRTSRLEQLCERMNVGLMAVALVLAVLVTVVGACRMLDAAALMPDPAATDRP